MKIGDRVIVNGNICGTTFKNVLGSIVRIDGSDPQYGIKFDIKSRDYHNCFGLCEDDEGYFVNEKNVTVLKLDDTFLEVFKNNDIAINCETEEEAEEFCKWMHDNKLEWSSGGSYLDFTNWDDHREETCYIGTNMYCPISFYEEEDYTIIKYSDLQDKQKREGNMQSQSNYKVIKPFILKEIMDKNPCDREFDKLVKELSEEFSYKAICKGELFFTEENWGEYKTLTDNKDWLLENGFIEEEVKVFQPFKLTFDISSKEELESLWCRLNCPVSSAKNGESQGHKVHNGHAIKQFDVVDEEMYRIEQC